MGRHLEMEDSQLQLTTAHSLSSVQTNCADPMEPEVGFKTDGAIIGGKVEKHLFLYTEKIKRQ